MDINLNAYFPEIKGPLQKALEAAGESRRVTEGSVLYEEGFPCPWVPFVLTGVIRVFKLGESGREITLYRVEGGQVCVLSSTCVMPGDGIPLPAVAVAESDVHLLAVPAHVFRKLQMEHPELQAFVSQALAMRLAEMMMVIDEVAFGRVDMRLANRLAAVAQDEPDATVETTHAQLAVELGSAREVISRILKDFERKGMVRLGRGKIEVIAPGDLKGFAENRF